MFVRLKTKANRDNVTLVAHKISDIMESEHGNTVIMDNGSEYVVEESERVIRSKMLKAFSNSFDEANEASEA